MAGKDHLADSGAVVPRAGAMGLARAAVVSMRPVQWTKGLLVFLPLAFSVNERWSTDDTHVLGELFLRALVAAVIFCALSGAVYIFNDLLDRQGDREHPRKRNRPIASGEMPQAAAQAIAGALMVASLVGSFLMDTGFGIVSATFVVMNLAYSLFPQEGDHPGRHGGQCWVPPQGGGGGDGHRRDRIPLAVHDHRAGSAIHRVGQKAQASCGLRGATRPPRGPFWSSTARPSSTS